MTRVASCTPRELHERLARGEDLVVLDVREPFEHEICRIEGSVLVPMSEIGARHGEFDPERTLVCVCHHGVRSAHVAMALARLGFTRVENLSGGIERWAREVDPSMARY